MSESGVKSAQVTLLAEVGRALQRTVEIDEILHVILTAVTMGDGLGFNRAFLLLVDETSSCARGRMGVGPSHPNEAEMIWKAIDEEDRPLSEMLPGRSRRSGEHDRGIMELAERLVFKLSGEDNIIARSLENGTSCVVTKGRDLREARPVADLERAHEELTQNQLQLLRAERMLAAGGLAATLIHDLKARVFSPFFTTKAEGSGLGLVIAKRTVTNYGGRITLESGEGVGTCFTLYLPVAT